MRIFHHATGSDCVVDGSLIKRPVLSDEIYSEMEFALGKQPQLTRFFFFAIEHVSVNSFLRNLQVCGLIVHRDSKNVLNS